MKRPATTAENPTTGIPMSRIRRHPTFANRPPPANPDNTPTRIENTASCTPLPYFPRCHPGQGSPQCGDGSADGGACTLCAMADVRAEMTANVWQVPAEVGQSVAEGDVLVILESMKMEIPVEAPKAGTITEVRVKPDDQVQEGDVLVVIV